ncbi:aminotransferase class III-fold pyridoxal phosphate-dependent enzyme [Affinirhizobium pseudoryzae]|uniref:aminotransferase class III-fold pyridoxal phosphate-dependent enzyme n=1 Tax=Allorhizobium pseudoryzae TaxID=379684 RepID=UPI0013EA7A3E|nr:aminotransferase class III-fold pyridoxal phosphate-dependent enzyme [Allorhizobium pseudoryzae]
MADADNELPDEAMPVFAWPDAELFLASHYGLSGEIEAIAADPPSYLVRYDEVTSRLDFCSDPDEARQFEAEAALLLHMHPETGRIEGPQPLETTEGNLLCAFEADEDTREGYARVCAFPAGAPAPASVDGAVLGGFAARLIRDLAAAAEDARDEEMPALWSASDLRQAGPTVVKILRQVNDPAIRDPIAKAMVTALRRVQALGSDLRSQLIHHHPVSRELVGTVTDTAWQPTGFVDPASLGEGWVVASLAAVCADLLLERPGDAMTFLPAVEAFHAELPLVEADIEALWPLIIVRIGLLRAAAERDAAIGDPDDTPWLMRVRDGFDRVTGLQPAMMEAAIRHTLDWPPRPLPDFGPLLPEIDPEKIRLVDLSPASTAFFDGNWRDPESDWRILARIAWDTKMGATRFGEYRLSRGHAQRDGHAENYALHVDICLPAGTVALAPFGGLLQLRDGRLLLNGPEACLHLEGLDTVLADGTALFAGDRLGVVAGAEGSVGGLRIRLSREANLVPPLFVATGDVGLWRQLAISPSVLLGIDADAPQPAEQRAFVRGWREHVFDATGRPFIDLTGGAGLLGHGHAGLADAAYHQWLLLNGLLSTPVEAEFQAALLQRLPGELDTVVALTGEIAAMELAQQLGERLYSEDESPLIADERRTGFGRTGHGFWAFDAGETIPDIVVTGSPVPGEPLAAVVMRRSALPQTLELPQPDASMVACRLGSTVIDLLDDPDLIANAADAARVLEQALTHLTTASEGRLAVSGAGLAPELSVSGLSAPDLAERLLQHGVIASALDDVRLQLIAPLCIARASLEVVVDALSHILGIPAPQAEAVDEAHQEEQDLQTDTETPD